MRQAVVVMGVSGSGKSAVAAGIAQRLGWRCIDGDDLHSAHNVDKMRRGQPLSDADRWPWLDRVGAELADARRSPAGVTLACSALRRAYRDRLRAACPGVRFVFLDGDAQVIAARLHQRTGHYMPSTLLDSQWQTLERPGADETDVLRLDIAAPVDEVIARAA